MAYLKGAYWLKERAHQGAAVSSLFNRSLDWDVVFWLQWRKVNNHSLGVISGRSVWIRKLSEQNYKACGRFTQMCLALSLTQRFSDSASFLNRSEYGVCSFFIGLKLYRQCVNISKSCLQNFCRKEQGTQGCCCGTLMDLYCLTAFGMLHHT